MLPVDKSGNDPEFHSVIRTGISSKSPRKICSEIALGIPFKMLA